jgi:hypothetical protein
VPGRYVIELEPEVREWLETRTLAEYAKVEAMADILADHAETLGEPYSRHLFGKTRELRFYLSRSSVRTSYWLAPGARVVLLTVFRKPSASSARRSPERSSRNRPASQVTRITLQPT